MVFLLQFFGIKDGGLPALVVQDKDNNRKYVAHNIEASDMPGWLQDFQVNFSVGVLFMMILLLLSSSGTVSSDNLKDVILVCVTIFIFYVVRFYSLTSLFYRMARLKHT